MERRSDRPQRRSVRLQEYDYSCPGHYFLTICTHRRQKRFGRVVDGDVVLREVGKVALRQWRRSGLIRREIETDAFVVMPNHVHGIVDIVSGPADEPARASGRGAPAQHWKPRSLGAFVGGYKAAVTSRVNRKCGTPGGRLWQRNYYEHIVRDQAELEKLRWYVETNPERWYCDRENPGRKQDEPQWDWLYSTEEKP